MDFLKGKKTYIISILGIIVTTLHILGKIDDGLFQTLMALLGSGAAATVAAKINRLSINSTQSDLDRMNKK